MAIIHARTSSEAREYMVLSLPECGGDVTVERTDAFAEGGRIAQRYVAGCADRGIRREFTFITDRVPPTAEGGEFGYGSQPSELIDAGQWYVVFARYAEAARAVEDRFAPNPPDPASAEQIYEWYARALAAVAEVLKFAPAGGELPESAFWTPQGRAIREQYGSQLTRAVLGGVTGHLERALRAYRDAYA